MSDNLTVEQRHKNMMHIRSKDTKPEMIVRQFLFARGLRYRLHVANLPGKPDMVFAKYKAVVFIQGCFWHQHLGCKYAAKPASNQEYWLTKLNRNTQRDTAAREKLESQGWRVLYIWECQLKPPVRDAELESLYGQIITYSGEPFSR